MTLAIEQFEYLKASETTALLRLSGRWSAGDPGDCTLVATTGGTRLVLEPLPHPPGPADPWRAAYSAPLKRVESGRTRFRLETPGGARVELPRPTARGAGTSAKPGAAAKPGMMERLRRSHETRAVSADHRR